MRLPSRLCSLRLPQPSCGRARDRAGAEQIAGHQVAAAAGVVRDELRQGPVEVGRVAVRHAVRRQALLAHLPRSGSALRARCRRRRSSGRRRPSRCGSGCGSPAGRGGCATRNGSSASAVTIHGDTVEPKLLPRNGPSGCRFPLLDVARRPVVDEAEPERCARRPRRSGSARPGGCRARPRPPARARSRACGTGRSSAPLRRAACAGRSAGAPARPTRAPTRRGCDRRPARICSWAQRVVRVAPAAAIGGVVDAGEEIGEVADRRRQVQPAIAGVMQQLRGERLGLGALGAVGRQQREDLPAQGAARTRRRAPSAG